VAGLIRDRFPVTVYNDEVVTQALVRQGVALDDAWDYAHSACHNVIVVGREAGSGPVFHNLPWLILLAMNGGRELGSNRPSGAATPLPEQIETFEQFWAAVREQVRVALADARGAMERWQAECERACPLLQSCLMRASIAQRIPCWRAATVNHRNHHLMGLATAVDSLVAVRQLVFEERELRLPDLVGILTANWSGQELLRERVRTRLPRYGQDHAQARELTTRLGQLWVDEVRAASDGLKRIALWPGFYSHMVHLREGARTAATPDGRRAGEPLSENLSPSLGTPRCAPTSILNSMAVLPFTDTPSGAATLALTPGHEMATEIRALIETYFRQGGLHLQVNVLDAATLEAAMREPERYGDLMVRVVGYSAYFTRLSRDVQRDVLRRHQGGNP
jgi:formate C-acetyltransferase